MAHELKYKLCYGITRPSRDEIFSAIEACEASARLFYCLVTLTLGTINIEMRLASDAETL